MDFLSPCRVFAAGFLLGTATSPAAAPDFATEIRPLLNARCTKCHGGVKEKGGVNLSYRAGAFAKSEEGNAVIVPGKPAESALVARIRIDDENERMPPDEPLKPEEIALLSDWISEGAEWPAHWAYAPRNPGAPPAVTDASWPANPIDNYVLARLESEEITPSTEADRYTLIRRLSLDLTGLPPSPADVDRFVRDLSVNAYEKVVDQYLASPHFGERWARHWLDQARYADSDGYEKDNARPDAWRWRDWVISAIDRDMPFDRFTIEQLAGDLLPKATKEQELATAFHLQTLFNREGGVDPEEDRVKRVIDRTNTTASVWLGLTSACTQCHNHPYDALRQTDFYGLFAFFNNADESEVIVGKNFRDELELLPLEQGLARAREEARPAFALWASQIREKITAADEDPVVYHPIRREDLELQSETGNGFDILEDGSVRATGSLLGTDTFTVRFYAPASELTGFRVETLVDPSLPNNGPGSPPNGNFVLSEFRAFVQPDRAKPSQGQPFLRAAADYSQKGFEVERAIDGNSSTGWAIAPEMGKPHHADFVLARPLAKADRLPVVLNLVQEYGAGKGHLLARFRILARSGGKNEIHLAPHLRDLLALAERSPEQDASLFEYFVTEVDSESAALRRDLEAKRADQTVKARVLRERSTKRRPTYLFHRGDFLQPDTLAGDIAPQPPAFLAHLKTEGPANRLDLARWLVAPENPLTARVIANNVWSHLFGQGLVATPEDFGTRGAPPTHPALLDWLADEFIRGNWSRKNLIRTIVRSRTYRQASAHRTELASRDPDNHLLHRQNRFRVEAEIVRDLHLSASGLLNTTVGGPSVFPPLPPDVAALSYADNFKWTPSEGPDRYRRGMYTFFKRTSPDPNLMTFDCPDSNVSVSQRNSSNTPVMALATLQNEVYQEAAAALSRLILSAHDITSDAQRITQAFRRCVARPPEAEELQKLAELLTVNRTFYTKHPDATWTAVAKVQPAEGIPPDEYAAWIATARILMNLDEFITRE